jgi:XTP/dITP diphosphohydrolase
MITKKPLGDKGFGYDSVFLVKQNGLTFGQMEKEEKDKISHRGLALKKMVKLLKKNIS